MQELSCNINRPSAFFPPLLNPESDVHTYMKNVVNIERAYLLLESP